MRNRVGAAPTHSSTKPSTVALYQIVFVEAELDFAVLKNVVLSFAVLDTRLNKADLNSCSNSADGLNNKADVDCFNNGKTLKNIKMDSNNEQIGSAICQPKYCINIVLIITPTDPNVSAKTCKNTPEKSNYTSKFTLHICIMRMSVMRMTMAGCRR
uniref:Uncharacterized protein n=1 Tax=Romanomermis culicivorax TaxID=13658 RepID=A0A915JTK2_ROMCU